MNTVKNIIIKRSVIWSLALAVMGGILFPQTSQAQSEADKLAELFGPMVNFEYAAPTATIIEHFGEGMIEDTLHDGIVSAQIDKAYYKKLNQFAPYELWRIYDRYMIEKDEIRQTTRRNIDSLLKITGYRVALNIVLIDDTDGLTNDEYSFLTTRIDQESGKRYVWPSTGNSSEDDGSGYYSAWVYVGAHWVEEFGKIKTYGMEKKSTPLMDAAIVSLVAKAIFIFDPSNFAALNEEASGYSRKNGTHVEELWPDKKNATLEGISSYFAYVAETNSEYGNNAFSLYEKLAAFQNDPGYRYMIQENSILSNLKPLKAAPHKNRDFVGIMGREYKWLDVPGFYLTFAPNTTYGFLKAIHEGSYGYGNTQYSSPAINRTISKMWEKRDNRDLFFLVNQLALELEDFSATSQARKLKGIDENDGLKSSMYPFFVLDVLTHFGMDEAQYKRAYTNRQYERQPRAFAEYWKHRENLRELAMPHLASKSIDVISAISAGEPYLIQSKLILRTQAR